MSHPAATVQDHFAAHIVDRQRSDPAQELFYVEAGTVKHRENGSTTNRKPPPSAAAPR
jgi:hypothetical protein